MKQSTEDEQMNQMAGMMFSMIKPLIKGHCGKPENNSVREQCDIIAGAVIEIFPALEVMVSLEDIKGLLYNLDQDKLDNFYEVVQKALQHRRT